MIVAFPSLIANVVIMIPTFIKGVLGQCIESIDPPVLMNQIGESLRAVHPHDKDGTAVVLIGKVDLICK